MKKQKVGSIIFWIAVFWAILWGVAGSILVDTALRDSTMDEVNQGMLAMDGYWMTFWAFGVPISAVVAAVGALIRSGAGTSTVLRVGIGLLLGLMAGILLMPIGHIPVLFGIGGTLILLCFMAIVWLWAKARMDMDGRLAAAADCKLIAYVFFLLSAWYTCGVAAMPFFKVFEGQDANSPLHLMLFVVLGWLFLFMGHYYSRKKTDADES